jgi:hypothetical protein
VPIFSSSTSREAALATGLRVLNPSSVEGSPAFAELVPQLADGPLVLESNGRAVAVLIDVERYRDMEAVYEWHQQVLQERRAS